MTKDTCHHRYERHCWLVATIVATVCAIAMGGAPDAAPHHLREDAPHDHHQTAASSWVDAVHEADSNTFSVPVCVRQPFCDDPDIHVYQKARCKVEGVLPSWLSNRLQAVQVAPEEYAIERLEQLLRRNIKGQDHIVSDVVRDVRRKLRHPDEPLVMHFAGDNGVGKTSMADWISAAISLRCHPRVRSWRCTQGDGLLSFSGTNYHGVPVAQFRASFTRDVIQHAKRYPRGMIVINDLMALDAELVPVLMPLFGRGDHFLEAPDVDLRGLIVIVTTDFGIEGRTRNKTLKEVSQLIEEEVRGVFGNLAGSHMRTYPFIPLSLSDAEEMVRLALDDWACEKEVGRIAVDGAVPTALIEQCVLSIATENGRAVSRLMADVIAEMDALVNQLELFRANVTIHLEPQRRTGTRSVAVRASIPSTKQQRMQPIADKDL